ncbi:ABC transporter permease [Moorena bouillonii]|uniref:Multidrug ABC transporter permease n=2 Tax=Moorena TaxID=1155738 RepID=A0A1U7N6D2_9CYAN|nr:ABC-2 family transporter protein [Moorena bouillonii]OLT61496.1 multidrug ABC transporter permease [Moorena bouillonii PNG]
MKRVLKIITTFLSVYYAHMMEYRAEIFFWVLSNLLPLILMGIWTKASQDADFGLNSIEFARYFISVFFIRQFNLVWVIFEFQEQVLQGKLSPRLLQPIDPVWHQVAAHLAERFIRMPFNLGLIGLFFLLYPEAAWVPNLGNLLLGCLVVAMSFALRFLMQYTFAMFAFWTERASAIEELSFLLYLFLSGLIAPLEVFPPLVREIAQWTPFPYLIHFPAALLIGLPVNVVGGILVILGWSLIFFLVNRWLWRKGLKHYSGMGA